LSGLERLLANKGTLTPFVGTGATIAVLPDDPYARWDGLLEGGIRRCKELGQSTIWAESTAARLPPGDFITYLAVADEISRRLAGFGEWDDWIERTVGRITFPRSAMHSAICKLSRIVLTTNYDLLLEEASNHEMLHWKQYKEVRKGTLIDETRHIIIHLHGVAKNPETVILSSWQYQKLLSNVTAQFWQSVLLSRRLLFIGCGSGLHDPNIGPALEFVQFVASPPPKARLGDEPDEQEDKPDESYILVRGRDLKTALREFSNTNIIPVAYGPNYSDLELFLTDLAEGREPKPSQDVHDYLTPPRSTPKKGTLDLAGPAEEALQVARDLARRALQALKQVERRSTLPLGVDGWAYADQLDIHERTAASVLDPIKRLHVETKALAIAVEDADGPLGWLTAQQEEPSLAGLFALADELAGLCDDLSQGVTERFTQINVNSKLTDDYRPAAKALQEVQALTEDIRRTMETLPRS
jgi:hypothetical protein